MKCLIIRTGSTKVDIKTYNMQEIGLAKALIRKGNICDIIYYAYDGIYKEQIIKFDENNRKIKIYWLNGKSILNNAVFDKKKLIEICNNYDVIQVAEYDQYTSFFLNKSRIKPVVIYHGPFFCDFKKKYNLVNKYFDKVFLKKYLKIQPNIISKSCLAEEYLRKKGFRNVTTIGVGMDKERFTEEETNQEVENLFKIIGNKKIILYIGQLEERRSVDFIIRTFAKVYENEKDTILLIIGKGKDNYVNMCENLVKEFGLEENIIFKTRINQEFLQKIYKRASVFLLPTKYEIFGMVLLEAMHFGVPTITTYNGGSSTLIEDKKSGFIIDELDEEKWANQIIQILNNDNNDISNEAMKKIECFTWDNLVDKFIEVYENSIDIFHKYC